VERSDAAVTRDHDDGQGNGVSAMDPDPVFVLCMDGPGSTWLQLTPDTLPDLACPPEPTFRRCARSLAVVWPLTEGAPLSVHRRETAGGRDVRQRLSRW
jgi:hypothetical protein